MPDVRSMIFGKRKEDFEVTGQKIDKVLYVFLDEAGNFDFSTNRTTYFVISSLSMIRPFPYVPQLVDLKYDLWEQHIPIEYFHASVDKQSTRNSVFNILQNYFDRFRLDSIVVEKRKTTPTLQADEGRFYKTILDILLSYILEGYKELRFTQAIIVTDTIPVERKRKDLEKAIKFTLSIWSRQHDKRYEILHHASKSDLNLQIVDYSNWAVYRKWERGDSRSYDLIKGFIATEFDVFRRGNAYFY